MKTLQLIFTVTVLSIAVNNTFSMSSNSKIEMHPYEVVRSYNGFEIRKYSPASFSYVTLNTNKYDKASGTGFSKLAGYIFGGNERQQQISMTSPVAMELEDQITMKFLIPSEYSIKDLPKPNDPDVKFVEEPAKYIAAVQFGGYANDRKINYFKKMLNKILAKHAIKHSGHFSYLGYNSPFEIFNRRNEIIVEVIV